MFNPPLIQSTYSVAAHAIASLTDGLQERRL